MSRIVFHESYIIIIPTYNKTASHKHPSMHLFYSREGCKIMVDQKEIQGNIILLKPNIRHAIDESHNCDFFLLLDPTSTIAKQLSDKYLTNQDSYSITGRFDDITGHMISSSDQDTIQLVDHVLLNMGISIACADTTDSRIKEVISKIVSGEWLNYHVNEIAEASFLSESRLTHLFKDEVGIPLKSYLLIRKMEHAYRIVSSGGNVTDAALESGFASSAHLAYTCKALTGISITDVFAGSKNSRFLKA